MKKFLCLILVLLMSIGVCGCGNNKTDDYSSYNVETIVEEIVEIQGDNISAQKPASSETDAASSQQETPIQSEDKVLTSDVTIIQDNEVASNTYYLNDAQVLTNIKLNGRCDLAADGINLNHAASAIEFNTDSSSVLLEVEAASNLYYTVMIDGEITAQHQQFEITGNNYVIAARGLGSGAHNIKFIRDSESRTDLKFTVVSIELDNNSVLLTRDADKKVIEFLGDSITSGYGNLAENGVDNSSDLKYLSATKAYPFLVASELGYDYRVVSMSGIALAKREGYPSFPEFYNLESYHTDRVKKYTSSDPQDVDIVVVNLGTNDVGVQMHDAKNSQSVKEYKQHFVNLITDIGYRKGAKIVFVAGVWYKEPITAINEAVAGLKTLGYNDVYALELKEYRSGGGAHLRW